MNGFTVFKLRRFFHYLPEAIIGLIALWCLGFPLLILIYGAFCV